MVASYSYTLGMILGWKQKGGGRGAGRKKKGGEVVGKKGLHMSGKSTCLNNFFALEE